MSLLKAKELEIKKTGFGTLELDFLSIIETSEEYTREDLIALIQIYARYSIEYLYDVSLTLHEPSGASQTMKFMNSYIVEIAYATNNKYYDQDTSYSLIDKAVQNALDNEGIASYEFISKTIDEVNASYEPEEETEED